MDIITANSLGDGRVVFLTAEGWSRDISAAEILDDKAALATALARADADAAANRVVEPYAIAVTRTEAGLVPTKLRERIRAEGPTTGNSRQRGEAKADNPPLPDGERWEASRRGEHLAPLLLLDSGA